MLGFTDWQTAMFKRARHDPGWGRIRAVAWIVCCAVWLFSPWAFGQQIDATRASNVKAAFLWGFCQDMTWPQPPVAQRGQPVVIGVLGESSLLEPMDAVLQRAKAKRFPLELRRFSTVDQLTPCHLLFLPEGTSDETARAAIDRLRGTHTLVVADNPEFLELGAAVAFEFAGDRVHIVIDLGVARREGVQIGPNLLTVARVVEPAATDESRPPQLEADP